MVLGKFILQLQLFRQLVAVAFKDRLDLFQPIQTGTIGDPAGRIKPLGRILTTEIQQAKADVVCLLWMGFGFELPIDPLEHFRTDIPRPVLEPPRCPLHVLAMAGRHVGSHRRHTWLVTAGMTGHHLLAEFTPNIALNKLLIKYFINDTVRYK
jgi:hypothetical protein